MTLEFKMATAQDADAIATLVNSAYRGDSSRVGWTTEADLIGGQRTDPEGIRALIVSPRSQFDLAYDGSALVGCVHLKQESDHLYFGMLVARPTHQSRGIGKLLLQHIDGLALSLGYQKIRITVIDQRPELISYYERRGFKVTGTSEPFPANDPRFGIPLVKNLNLIEMIKTLEGETDHA